MSRIGKLPIPIPNGVTVTIDGQATTVTGPKGSLTMTLHHHVQATTAEHQVTVTVRQPNSQYDRALWGLSRMLLSNMIIGVTQGYAKQLEISGVGFKAQASGQKLTLNLGFSHPIEFPIPDGLHAKVDKNTITIEGVDKQLVGETAAKIRRLKPPEPYKGKGIKYSTETVRRKAGKVVKATAGK
jgi:large subunit ribosomal protein L6